MDLYSNYRGQRFVWDTEKASGNLSKHGVSFDQACEVFFDSFLYTQDATDGDEQREAAIGATSDLKILFVVHLVRERETIRIISARPATGHERRQYEDND
ncbi:BrnT family toxin [Granulicella sp. WH15]|uniref:BrnT family toxin n=1 Tax=Granulicella sp. WH15 TaxID=2602070 RepID=UPI001367823F|nr:BrnT family toxin [Granulicella sp. WH15]QHN04544.1 BrnT family toxin [Granulicella sp. WH15]